MSKTISIALALSLSFLVQGLCIESAGFLSPDSVSLGDGYSPGEQRFFALGIDISGGVVNLYDQKVYLGRVEYRKLVQHDIISIDKGGAKLKAIIEDMEVKPYIFGEPVAVNFAYESGLVSKEVTIAILPDGELAVESSLPTDYSNLNGDALALVFILLNRLYPTGPVNIGDSWSIEQPLVLPLGDSNGFQGKLTGEAKLMERSENGWLADFRGKLAGGVQYKGGALLLGGEISAPVMGEINFNGDKGSLENLKLAGTVTGEFSGALLIQPFRLSVNAELQLVAKRFYPHNDGN
jgi:hypothetical protein